MAFSEETRSTYVREFVRNLMEAAEDQKDIAEAEQVLRETMLQTLVAVEGRFRSYTHTLPHKPDEQSLNNMRSHIIKMEKMNTKGFEQRTKVSYIHKKALKKCYPLLTSDLDLVNSSIIDDLLSSDVMSVSDKDSIIVKDTRIRQNDEFFSYILGRLSFEDFHRILLPALMKDHPHVAEALISELDRLEEEHEDEMCVACRARKYVQLKRIATPLLQQDIIEVPLFTDLKSPGMSNNTKWTELQKTVSDKDIIAGMEKKYPDLYKDFVTRGCYSLKCTCHSIGFPDTAEIIHLKRSDSTSEDVNDSESRLTDMTDLDQFEDVSADLAFLECDEEREYKMTAVPRGICLIINNKTYGSNMTNRVGSEHDVEEMRNVFRKLQFSVDVKENLSVEDMVDTLELYARKDHSEFDAFVCIISTHGTSDDLLIGCDGREVSLDSVISPFESSKCPTLAGKPKLFFIEATRGVEVMYGHKKGEGSVPDRSDILIGHCTARGYASFRNPKHGGKFIQTLARVLDTHGDDHDLLSCLEMVNRSVSNMSMISHRHRDAKQVPAPMFTLTKKVHLTSDPLWPNASEEAQP